MKINPQSLLDNCQRFPNRPVFRSFDHLWTGEALLAAVEDWRSRLRRLGARRVAVRADNSGEWAALDLALLLDGYLSVPIPDFFSPDQLTHVIDSAGIDLWVSDDHWMPDGFKPASEARGYQLGTRSPERVPTVPEGTAKITFTSGSTGTPKGVCLSAQHMMIIATSLCASLAVLEVTRHLSVLPYALLLENVAGIYANLLNGSLITATPLSTLGINGSSGLDVQQFVQAFNDERPHSVILVPQQLLALTGAAEFGLPLPDSLKFAAVGGGKVSADLLKRAAACDIPAYEGYGLSECGSVVALNRPGSCRTGTAGRPLPHLQVAVANGEIMVIGASMLGYLGEAPHVSPMIATGDSGRVDDDGFLIVEGRLKNCFITSFGRNVQPEWVESELLAEIDIAQAAVFGEASPINVALIVTRSDAAGVERAIARANDRLPDYARIGRWVCVAAERFSEGLTANGRPRRHALEEIFASELSQAFDHAQENHLVVS